MSQNFIKCLEFSRKSIFRLKGQIYSPKIQSFLIIKRQKHLHKVKMPEEEVKTYTYEEIAEHSTEKSTWIVIKNNVYDVTAFLEEHPGGPEIILDWAGQEDATDAFEDASHSLDAREQMKAYKIGEVAEEERALKAKTNGTSKCYKFGLLIPGSMVLAGLLVYTFIRLRK